MQAVLLQQVEQWVLHGEVLDPYHEFFIAPKQADGEWSPPRRRLVSRSAGWSAIRRAMESCVLAPSESACFSLCAACCKGLGPSTWHAAQEEEQGMEGDAQYEWEGRFMLRSEVSLMPRHAMAASLAQRPLRVGRRSPRHVVAVG
jgi:hypothetical protein